MDYKFKVGDKVKIKSGMDLGRLGIHGGKRYARLSGTLTVKEALSRAGGWMDKEYSKAPTYTVNEWWSIPEAFLEETANGR